MSGTLFIVPTPIGNLSDITIRAIKTLFSVDYLLCEDTRTTGILLTEIIKRYNTILPNDFQKPKLIAYYDEVENQKTPELIKLILEGKNLGIVSENGTPLISDPGFVMVREAIRKNIKVTSLPGPSAAITALTTAGLAVNNFYFAGYLPKTQQKRIKELKLLFDSFKTLKHKPTVILYESPHRLINTLEDTKTIIGDTQMAICRELTKIHEEVFRGTISDAITHFKSPKGEFVILI